MDKQFKYKVVTIYSDYDSSVERDLNNYGKDGWELINMYEKNGYFKCVLKKEIILSVPKTYNKE